jgi:uncharacterized protein YwbE
VVFLLRFLTPCLVRPILTVSLSTPHGLSNDMPI